MENPQHFECDTPDCCYWSVVIHLHTGSKIDLVSRCASF